MNPLKIEFNPDSKADLELFIPEEISSDSGKSSDRPFILVVPGGGYDHFGSKEQASVAEFFNSKGFASAVLHYTLAPMKFPQALYDLALAVAFIRQKSSEYKINSSKITVLGFSAGGHLSGCLGAFWNTPLLDELREKLPDSTYSDNSIFKPDGLCLCYPVISSDRKICHEGSVLRLTENLTEEESKKLCTQAGVKESPDWKESLRELISLEKRVTGSFPPVFMWHTKGDTAVPPENTLRMEQSLKSAAADYEYHLYEEGPHGLALAENTSCESWTSLFVEWVKKHNLW